MPKPKKYKSLYKKCVPYPNEDNPTESGWFYENPIDKNLTKYLPKCALICPEKPPKEEKQYLRKWRQDYLTVGEIANYTCQGIYQINTHCINSND